jgi:EAL domain-containing protein (putative c-di-GMP-specific phosphodiesterase class I)/GGDEF domain-containing protein
MPTATETQILVIGAWGELLIALAMAAMLAWQHRAHPRPALAMWMASFLSLALYIVGASASFALAQRGSAVDDPWRAASMLLALAAAHAQVAWLALGTLRFGRETPVPLRVQTIGVGGSALLGAMLALGYAGGGASDPAMLERLGLLYMLQGAVWLGCGVLVLHRAAGRLGPRALGTGFALFGLAKLGLVAIVLQGSPGTAQAPATGLVVLVELIGQAAAAAGIALWLLGGERERAAAAQTHLSTLLRFDPVTGLPNRAAMAESWPALRGADAAMLVLAIEGLERAGVRLREGADRVLRSVAGRIEALHGAARVAQLDRARFAVLVDGGSAGARAAAAALLQTVEGTLDAEAPQEELLPVAGIAVRRPDEDLPGQLARADAACDAARRLGGARVVDAEAAPAASADPLPRLRALREAFERGQFELHFQPQVDATDGALHGFEALVRWRHPEAGVLPPGRFMGAIERTGLSRRLDATVVELACAQVRAWLDAGLRPPPVAVNLGAESLAEQELPEMLGDALVRHRLSASQLAIELTETAALADTARCARVLGRLRAFGFGVALDDFGTGFSSVAHLRDLPVDTIKIDRRFVQGAAAEPRDAALVHGLAGLAASLGMRVVAEGVETSAQSAIARTAGIAIQQGWYFAAALEAADAAALIAPPGTIATLRFRRPGERC